jgi:hypothetical protein
MNLIEQARTGEFKISRKKYDDAEFKKTHDVRPELFPIIDDLLEMEPHDLVTPETWFPNENSAYGFVWRLFMDKVGSCG